MKSFLRKFFLGLIVAQALFLTPFSVELKVNIPKTESSLFAFQENKSSQSPITVDVLPQVAHADILLYGNCSLSQIKDCFLGSILTFYHYLFFTSTQILAAIAAYFMDVIIKFSISSSFYRGIGIIEVGWEILRDLSNIIFLFALLYIAFRFAINGTKDGQAKKSLINVIVAALVVNFSLFICYFLIDASNLFAHVFYNRITTEASVYPVNENGAGQEGLATVLNDIKSPATAFLAAVNPQRMLLSGESISTNGGIIKIFTLIMGMAVVNGIAIWVFLSVALLFLKRILGLIILSFLSPLAFSSLAIPEMKKQKYVGFDDWLNNFLRMSFAAPIFTFFLWVATKFASNEGVIGTIQRNSGGDWILDMLNVFLVMALIAGILVMSKKITQDLAGNFSKQITGMIGKAVAGTAAVGALAVAAPVAGVGMLARAGAGVTSATGGLARGARALNMTGAADRLQKAQEKLKSNRFGTTAANAGRALMSTKLNVTKVPGFSQLAGKELTSIVGKVPGVGVSARELERKAVLYGMRNVPLYRDKEGKWKRNFLTGRQHQEAELAYDKEKEKIRGERGKWQEDLKKEREKFEKEKEKRALDEAAAATRNRIEQNTALDPRRQAERDAHNAVLENSDLVKKETEAMDALKGELANLTAQLNAAKGSGNTQVAKQVQKNIDVQKVIMDARKKGIEISKTQAASLISNTTGGARALIDSNKNLFGEKTTYATSSGAYTNVENETLQGRHQHEKNLLNEEERNLIRAEITNLRTQATVARTAGRDDEADTLNKKASHLSQKMESMLTDSSKIDEAANKASNKK